MRAINTFCTIMLLLALFLTCVHYAALFVIRHARQGVEPVMLALPEPVLEPVPPPGEVEKFDAAVGARWVEEARATALRIEDAYGEVTADCVWSECPPPNGVDGRLLASVFSRSEWEIVGRRMSTRGRNAARQIAVWKRKEAIAA